MKSLDAWNEGGIKGKYSIQVCNKQVYTWDEHDAIQEVSTQVWEYNGKWHTSNGES